MQRIKQIRSEFDVLIETQKRVEAVEYMIAKIEEEIIDIVNSPDFKKVPKDVKHQMVLSRGKAVKYWQMQLDKFIDDHVARLVNKAARIESAHLKVTFSEVVKAYKGEEVDRNRSGAIKSEIDNYSRAKKRAVKDKVAPGDMLDTIVSSTG